MSEFGLIETIAGAITAPHGAVALGIGDDCALLDPVTGMQLAVSTDTLNEGVHFLAGTDPQALGHKSLAVSLSDLAAMGAQPRYALLNLSLPTGDKPWVKAFMRGFARLSERHQLALIGGDTCAGPLGITVTVFGHVPTGSALLRSGARVGDDLWLSGNTGEAALALSIIKSGKNPPSRLKKRLESPQPRVDLGLALSGLASACIDVSDGLLADLGHIVNASGCGAQVTVESLPLGPEMGKLPPEQAFNFMLAGGDDYELCFTSAKEHRDTVKRLSGQLSLELTRFGTMGATKDIFCLLNGSEYRPQASGWEHFNPGLKP